MDLALTPVMDDETQTRELFRSQAAQTCVGQEWARNITSTNSGATCRVGAPRAAAEHEFPSAAH
jgi:hypothetical protein